MNNEQQPLQQSAAESVQYPMVAKTFQGLEDVLAQELRNLGADNVEPGRRMVSFTGDKAMMYRANLCCRTALRILKPFHQFRARTPESLYDRTKEFDWSTLLDPEKTFSIETTVNSNEFKHSLYVAHRVKDAIADFFRDRSADGRRPGVRLQNADAVIDVHISGTEVILSLDSSGESLHRRGYRVAQTDAPINEVLAAGIILKSGWNGQSPLVDPMCGSGTFLIEAALIAANINPGIYRKGFAFEKWNDFDEELFQKLYNDDSAERSFDFKIYGGDISPKAIAIASQNIKSAGVGKYIDVQVKALSQWDEAPAGGVLITNPPYGERISVDDMDGLYSMLGDKLKHVFTGYHAWIIGYHDEYFAKIGLAASQKEQLLNGSLECELREYIMFQGDKKSFMRAGGSLKGHVDKDRHMPARSKSGKPAGKPSDRSAGKPFNRTQDKPKTSRFGKPDKTDSRRDKFTARNAAPVQDEPVVSENPLAARRNEAALKSILNRRPTLPGTPSGTVMRSRRGWKKK